MKRALITGATGFIGLRLAEVAFARNIPVVGLVRSWSRAARLARLPIPKIHGDVLDLDSLRQAMQGCDVVFHCAVDSRLSGRAHRRSSVQGTTNVLQAALETGVKRVVHVSSVAVYSYRPGPDTTTEAGAMRYSGDAYCNGKIDAEKAVWRYYRKYGLPVTVLRPTIVYGPFGGWTIGTISAIRKGRMVLVDGGRHICNSLYVDNLIEAMLLAADKDVAVGEAFHISDAPSVTWKAFIEAHASALRDPTLALREMTVEEITEARSRMRKQRPSSVRQALRLLRDWRMHQLLCSIPVIESTVQASRTVARILLPMPIRQLLWQKFRDNSTSDFRENAAEMQGLPLPSEPEVDIYTTDVVFRIDKAHRILGYTPKVDFAEGMKRTAVWIKWARL